MKFLVSITLMLLTINANFSEAIKVNTGDSNQISKQCYDANGYSGECVELAQCPKNFDLSQTQPVSPETLHYLRKSHCGFNGKVAKTCCPSTNELIPDLNTCGVHLENKIYGGTETAINEFPWVALLEYTWNSGGGGFYAEGVLVNSRYVITAARVITGHDFKPSWKITKVRLGEYDKSTIIDCIENECSPLVQDILVESTVYHEAFEYVSGIHDIALLRLATKVVFTDYVKPICLPLGDLAKKTYAGIGLWSSGWGKKEDGKSAEKKLKIMLPSQPEEACHSVWQSLGFKLGAGQVCVGGAEKKDLCSNLGAPVMALETVNNRGNWYLYAVSSFSIVDCGRKGVPGVYTSIGFHIDWVIANMKP